jgi:hypothetical protein
MIALFDYTKLLFTANDKQWKEVTSMDKSRNFFMANRFLSIKYPVQVAVLSHMKINASAVEDYWHKNLGKLYKSVPSWMYAKTKKKEKEAKKREGLSEEMIKWYCQQEEIGRKEFDYNVSIFGEEFTNELSQLEKTLKSQGYLK